MKISIAFRIKRIIVLIKRGKVCLLSLLHTIIKNFLMPCALCLVVAAEHVNNLMRYHSLDGCSRGL